MVVQEPRRGFGAACHAGLLAATADVVCFLHCDGSFDLADLPKVAGPVLAGQADLVLGQRRPTARGAWPPHARLANRLLALRIRRRAGVRLRDLGPMRAARREVLLGLQVADRRRIDDDGGFWSLGLRRPRECDLPALLHDVPMSTDHTGADQRLRLAEAGMHVRILPTLRDVDTADDADHVAALTPASRFRAELDALQQR